MEPTAVQKSARVLNVLILAALVCNLICLYLVPAAVLFGGGLAEGIQAYVDTLLHTGEDDIIAAPIFASLFAWFWFWGDGKTMVPTLTLALAGGGTAAILWQARKVLGSILRGEPFSQANAAALGKAACCCFLVSAAALGHTLWVLLAQAFQRSLTAALFVPVFFAGGLLCLVLSALFRQAAELKADSELTI